MKYIVTNEMNGIMEILDSKGVIAHANSIGGYDIDSLNSAIILLKREGYRVFESQDENRTLSGMDIEDFYEWMNSDNVIKNRDGSYSTQDSNFRNRIGSIDELKRYYKREFGGSYAYGGKVAKVGEPYDSMTKYQLEKELNKLNEKISLLRNKYGSYEAEEITEIHKETDKIITLLYGENFSGVGRKYYYSKGGKVDSNFEMVKSQAKELMHHSKELMQVLKKHPHIEAWVVAKIERATTDLSDVTHYLDGTFAKGGEVGSSIKGITNVEYKDNGKTLLYGSKNNKTRISLVNMSKKDIEEELEFELEMLERQKRDLPRVIEADKQVQNSFTSTLKEKDDSRKIVEMIKKNLEVLKTIVIPFYEENLKNFAKGGRINYSEYYKMGGKVASCEKFDENGERKIDLKSIKELTDCVNKLPQTKDFYFVNGEYTPERKRLHKQIIYNIKKDLVCVQNDNPIAILMGGSPASGKSTFLKRYRPYLLEEEILKVDADEIRSKLPEYEGYNATQTHLETKDIVNLLLSDRNIGIPCKFDLIYDGTMNSTKSYLPLIDLLKSLGYKIFVVYMDKVPKDVVVNRALQRYKKSGRFVPLEVIEDFFEKGKTALNEVKQKVDGYMVIDGSNTDYKIIEKGGMQLPKSRVYSKIGEHIKITPDKVVRDYKFGGNVNM
jgi:predicted ABC-type ATPase